PTLLPWLSTNQSAEPTLCPLIRVWVRLGLVPRRLTRSASSKPPSSAEEELMFTPGRRCRVSATLCAGSLPTSSAVTTSRRASASRLVSRERSIEPRMPVTTTVSSSVACCRASCACTPADMARPVRIAALSADLQCFMMSLPSLVLVGPEGRQELHQVRRTQRPDGSAARTPRRVRRRPVYCSSNPEPRYQLAAPITPSCPCSTSFTETRSSASRIDPLLRKRARKLLLARKPRICGRIPPAR